MDYTVSFFFRVIHVTLVLQACQMGLNRVLIHRKTILQQCFIYYKCNLSSGVQNRSFGLYITPPFIF
jgi:hypothetical protein